MYSCVSSKSPSPPRMYKSGLYTVCTFIFLRALRCLPPLGEDTNTSFTYLTKKRLSRIETPCILFSDHVASTWPGEALALSAQSARGSVLQREGTGPDAGALPSLSVLQFIYTDDFGRHGGEGLLEHVRAKPLGEAHGGAAPLAGPVLQLRVCVGWARPAGQIRRWRLNVDSCCLGTRTWRVKD